MKRIFATILVVACSLAALAQYVGDGYYRVHNKKTSRYIYVLDNTGSINASTASADMGAIELYKDTARIHHDPACIIYAHQVSTGKFDLKAQGTGVYDIIGYYVDVYQKSDGSYQVYAEGKYLDDDETSSRDLGFLGTLRNGEYRLWLINQVDNAANYFGVLPTLQTGNKYYKPFYAAFPITCASAGMKIYYISRVYNNAAILTEVTGTIPASTPVFIECSAPNQWQNKLTIGGTVTTTVSGNKLGGVYFNNPNRQRSHDARTAFNPVTMRTLAVSPDGQLCFTNQNGLSYLNANESYLQVPASAADTLFVMTEDEYEVFSKASSITLSETTLSLFPEQTTTLVASILPTTVAVNTVSWSSSNPAVASVDAQGVVTANMVGTAVITASTTDGTNLSATCSVTVHPILATGVTLSRGLFSGVQGDTVTLTVSFVPTNTTDQSVSWTTSNPEVATVDAHGLVTILNVGMATITATTADGSNVSASCTVMGNPIAVTSIVLSDTQITGIKGDTTTLWATVLPQNATDKTLSWRTSNAAVATVTDGLVTIIGVGTATITVSANDGSGVSATCAVTGDPILVSSIQIQSTSQLSLDSLHTGDSFSLSTTVLPNDATSKALVWTTSDASGIRILSQNAMVCSCVAVSVGSYVITAAAQDSSGVTEQITVTVVPTLASSLAMAQDSALVSVGDSLQLLYTLLPTSTTDKTVVWTSSDTTLVTVSATGFCHAVGAGTALVTVATIDGSGLTASTVIQVADTVVPPTLAASITLSEHSSHMLLGDSMTLSVTVLPLETTDKSFVWSCTDTAVLSLDTLGRVHALRVGTALVVVTTLDGTALSDTCVVQVRPIMAESVSLSLREKTLHVADTFSLTAIVLPLNTTDASIVWTTTDSSVVTVDSLGFCKAVGLGEAAIVVSTLDGSALTDTCHVTVTPILAESLSLLPQSATLHTGDTLRLTYSLLPLNITNPAVRWSSSDTAVLTVDSTGLVTALSLGSAQVKLVTLDGSNLSASCAVMVTPILTDSIALSLTELTLTIGDSATLTAHVFPDNATNGAVLYSSSAASIVSVDHNGLVRALSVGTAVITASTADGTNITDSCIVTVEPVYVSEILLSIDSASLFINQSTTVTATVLPDNATFRMVEWSTSDSTILAVTQDGRITGLAEGVALLYATAIDGSGVEASIPVEVREFTAINTILASDPANNMMFDILGRRLYTIPSPGFYIINGKMTYIVR